VGELELTGRSKLATVAPLLQRLPFLLINIIIIDKYFLYQERNGQEILFHPELTSD
jgi:hypothetical protein